jgi:HK97 family phage portal protein
VRIIGEDLSKLPLPVFRRENGLIVKQPDHTLSEVLNWQPNPEMSAMSFRNTIVSHAVGWGNGYAEKVRDQNGNVIELWILTPDRVTPKRRDNGELFYEIREGNGTTVEASTDKIFHIPGFGYDGVQGYNPIQIARESLGLAAAAEEFGSKFFGNGAKTSLALTFPNSLTEKAHKNLQRSIEQQVSGDNQHRVLLIEEGGKVETMALSQKDSQYLETREFSIEEICRWFRVNPNKVADLRRATFSNIEEQNIDHVNDTLMPWFIRVEQAIRNQLFTETDQQAGFYVKHNANALLRGDSESRSNFYKAAINDGWMNRNEVRELEDLNPAEGLDTYLIPLNMREVGEEPEQVASNNDAFVEDVAGRIATAEERGLSARVDKAMEDRERFNAWASTFYFKHENYIDSCMKPIFKGDEHEDITHAITNNGFNQILLCENPAEHIKTWNRKQEIIDIINEALTCTTK